MRRILGLDLGSSSIGWAIIDENEEMATDNQPSKEKIVAIGSKIIPLTTSTGGESEQFIKGQAITKNADRTARRTQRKGYDRYQLRRKLLIDYLQQRGMWEEATLRLGKLDLWGTRAKAVEERISLRELGRVLCHINQKRGYRATKDDYGEKQKSAHVGTIMNRYNELQQRGLTIGQDIYANLLADPAFRCKELIYPRMAYIEEYDRIMRCQRQHYPEVLTQEAIDHIRDYIIFYQRPLRSCKHLVSRCELERHDKMVGGRMCNCGPRVAPRSSPLFQVCKIWESINNLNIQNKSNDSFHISLEQKQAIFNHMNLNEKLTAANLKQLLGVKSKEWQFGKSVGTGLQGNTTRSTIAKALGKGIREDLLRFDLRLIDGDMVDTHTGEIAQVIDPAFEKEPLYRLWHALYSISDMKELDKVLQEQFGITDPEMRERLCQIDFVKSGYGNKSSRAIRKILPHLMDGEQYYTAKCKAGYDDTTPTKEINESRKLAERLLPIPKGELRQPVVEKILNQLVNLVNGLMEEYGTFAEIRVELARELKQSSEERREATERNSKAQRENDEIAKRIKEECGQTPTRNRIQKFKLCLETTNRCIYCDSYINDTYNILADPNFDVEHIIPRSVLFDDSYSNKACSCRKCNKEKGNMTAYDYMESKGEGALQAYIERVNKLAEDKKISYTKRNKLLMKGKDIPSDFIERQLRESQYIAKKAKEMLQSVCYNVYSTSGTITDFIRHLWGWDNVLHDLNFERYQAAGLTEPARADQSDSTTSHERIKGWNKRMDHRHHAIDALTIACTKQGYIQRISNLNSLKEEAFTSFRSEEQGADTRHRLSRLERYIIEQPHFSTAEVERAVSEIAVSFKGGKRSASSGRNIYRGSKLIQRGVIVPRGPLSEESVYGQIEDPKDHKKRYVIKYPLTKFADPEFIKHPEKLDQIVDKAIREKIRQRLMIYKDSRKDVKGAFGEPLCDHQGHKIRSVRCFAHLQEAEELRRNSEGKAIAFVKSGNNHHVVIYINKDGGWEEHICTFWHAVERKKYGLPAIITDPEKMWDSLTDRDITSERFLRQLPQEPTWRFNFSMQQNEMFILGMEEEAYREAMECQDYATLSKYLYRVQKISSMYYVFRHHLETSVDDKYDGKRDELLSMKMGKMIRITSMKAFKEKNPHKVHVSVIGKISEL